MEWEVAGERYGAVRRGVRWRGRSERRSGERGGGEGEAGGGEGAGAAVEGDGEVAAGFDDEGVGGVSVAELHEGLGTSGQVKFEGGRAVFVQDYQLVLVKDLDN